MKKILLSILCACVFMVTAHATLRMPDITVTKITTTGVNTNVGFKVKDSNEWLKADAEGKWTLTSTDTPVQGAIGEKDYSGFFFNANSTSNNQTIGIYDITYTLADINDPANGIVVDPTTTGGTLLVKRRIGEIVIPGTPGIEKPEFTVPTNYFVIKGNNDLYVIIYKGKVYGTSDIEKATKFEAYLLANADHNVSCVQTAVPATCTAGGHNAVYQCSICQKYFKEETCETETTIADEEIPAGHTLTAYNAVAPTSGKDGNIAYWSCSKCGKYFGDEACEEEVANNSWVRTMVSGTITWADNDDFDGIRPESVKITLLRGGNELDDITVTASGNWEYCFTELPKYNAGTPIVYSISEHDVTGYTAQKEDNNVTYTHTHTHTFVPAMDGENPSFTWTGYTAAVLNLKCSNTKCTATSSVDATSITSEVTTVPTTEKEGVLTYTAKVTYNEVEYVSMAEVSIDKITAENITTVTEDKTLDNNSVTVIAATTESVTETHTVTAPTNGTANIVLAGGTEGSAANVNVSVPAGAIINIISSEANIVTIKGNINVAEGGTINLSNVKIEGELSGDVNVNKDSKIDITDATVNGKINATKATVLAGALEIDGLTVDNEGKQVAGSVNLADAAVSCPIVFIVPGDKVTVARQLAENVSGTMMLSCTVPVSAVSGAKIYEFTGVSKDMTSVDMNELTTGNLEAYKPYCIIPTADKITLGDDDVTFPKTPSEMGTTTVDGWVFEAINKAKEWNEGDSDLGRVYGFAAQEKDDVAAGDFVKAVAGASVVPGRCILVAPDEASEAKGINGVASSLLPASIKVYFHNADETTGIAEIDTTTGEITPVVWYDLNGRRISQPTKGGIYIKDNKKVMVK